MLMIFLKQIFLQDQIILFQRLSSDLFLIEVKFDHCKSQTHIEAGTELVFYRCTEIK